MKLNIGSLVYATRNITEDDLFYFCSPEEADNIVIPENTKGRVSDIEEYADGDSVCVDFFELAEDYEWWCGHLIQDGVIAKVVE